MHIGPRKKIVLLGMICNMPFAGVIWQYMHYMLGLERLGFDVYYVEAPAKMPTNFMVSETDDGVGKAVEHLNLVMKQFGFGDRWAYHAVFDDDQYYGMTRLQLQQLYASAELIVNMHGGTIPLPEHYATDRLVYLETDPVQLQIELAENNAVSISILESHCAFFTFGELLGQPGCKLPASDRFHFLPTRQPVLCDLWQTCQPPLNPALTTVGNWVQDRRTLVYQGETYYWSKHLEFLKFIDLPSRTAQPLELALSSFVSDDKALLESKGWRVRRALDLSMDAEPYRLYIQQSYGEFTVAKDQNVRLRSGWFSDRSATYLAAGRPVITQETGFSECLPTGQGLLGFASMDEIVAAIDQVSSNYAAHAKAARIIGRECFGHDVVLPKLLGNVGVVCRQKSHSPDKGLWPRLPRWLVLTPRSRDPLVLADETQRTMLARPMPYLSCTGSQAALGNPCEGVSIVVLTHNNLMFTRLCLESILENTTYPNYEVIVVDNASSDGTLQYLRALASRCSRIRLTANATNVGFAAANNQALVAAQGKYFVLLNNDTIVPPGWLERLIRHCDDRAVGLVGPVTNRTCNEAQIETNYATYGEMLDWASQRSQQADLKAFDIRMLAMYCVAMRRDVYRAVGPVDERFGIGLFEDDDYSMRVRAGGFRVVCAEDVFVHHFGGASFGHLAGAGNAYGALFHENRRRWENKWQIPWSPYSRRPNCQYECLVRRIQELVEQVVPAGQRVLVASKGDDNLCQFRQCQGQHFPQAEDGGYAGYHPADSEQAIRELEGLVQRGADMFLVPATMSWWYEHYQSFFAHLDHHYEVLFEEADICRLYRLQPVPSSRGQTTAC